MSNYLPPSCIGLDQNVINNLRSYQQLLVQWNQRINLIGKSTLDNIGKRHFDDCLGLLPYLPKEPCHIADFGSGAGFPGLIIAMSTKHKTTLIESIQKKCSFLQEVARLTHVPCTIYAQRIETLPPKKFNVVTARALAPLRQLWQWAEPCLELSGYAVFLKGNTDKTEIEIEELRDTFPQISIQPVNHPFTNSKIVIISNNHQTI